MYYNHFRLKDEEYKKLPFENRFIVDMISEMIEVKFAEKIIGSLMKRSEALGPGGYDIETRNHVLDKKKDRESAFNGYTIIKRLYESEFGELDSFIEEEIYKSADRHSDELLEEYGWNEKAA